MMKCLKFATLSISMAFVTANAQPSFRAVDTKPSYSTLTLTAGQLTILSEPQSDQILLNKKPILNPFFSAEFQAKYTFAGEDIVVLKTGNGANGQCSVEYYFLSIRAKGDINLSPMITCHAEADLDTKIQGAKILATIPKLKEKGSDKYVYENRILTENGKIVKN